MSMDPSETKKGLFVTLEGGDGAGKTTQINNIERFFEKKGLVVVRTREPGGTEISEKLRDILLDRENGSMEAVTEMLIYAAARAQIVRELIMPALNEGKAVICDRFVDSSIAYQEYGRGLGSIVAEVNEIATGGLRPDITFWMDIDPEKGKTRASGAREPDRLELEAMDFHYRVYEGYKKICENDAGRVRRIDASLPVDEIRDIIYSYLEELCESKGRN